MGLTAARGGERPPQPPSAPQTTTADADDRE